MVVISGCFCFPVSRAWAEVCEPARSVRYEGSWQRQDFSILDPSVVIDKENGRLVLRPGRGHPDSDSFLTAEPLEVRVTFVHSGSEARKNHLGYFLKSTAQKKGYVSADGSLDRTALVRAINFTDADGYDKETFHYIWTCLADADGDSILDKPYGEGCLRSFPEAASIAVDYATTEEALAAVDDGTGIPFLPDGDGRLTMRDMTKSLGLIGEGQEIVFFFVPDGRFHDVFLTETFWNGDKYVGMEPCASVFADGTQSKKYRLSEPASEDGTCSVASGWLTNGVLRRLREVLGIVFRPAQEILVPVKSGEKFSHVVVGLSEDLPGVRVMGWEEQWGGGDTDHNDVVFTVTVKAAGRVVSQELSRQWLSDPRRSITSVDLTAVDRRAVCTGLTSGFSLGSGTFSGGNIRYGISVDNGTSWIPVDRWDEVTTDTAGFQTRKAHLDLLSLGRQGNALKWKAVLETINAQCEPPEIVDVRVDYTAADQSEFSRSDPVILGNVLYSSTLETISASGAEAAPFRGHLRAYAIYDPADPTTPLFRSLWDAGRALAERDFAVNPRTLYSAVQEVRPIRETCASGDGESSRFQGTLSRGPLLSGSAVFKALSSAGTPMVLQDSGVGTLHGDGGGTIDGLTGEYTLEFVSAPCDGCPVIADYAHWIRSDALQPFSQETVTAGMLGLNDELVQGKGFTWDLNRDGLYDDADRRYLVRWVLGFTDGTLQRTWPLDGIDHSTPAVVGPPGLPPWYFGTHTAQEERDAFNLWRQSGPVSDRPTAAYVGSLGGMIHAFRAGAYRHGDDPRTPVKEHHGYFLLGEYGDGEELWAFVPPSAVSRLKSKLQPHPRVHPPVVDASPSVHDIVVPSASGPEFKTVLISAHGAGGDSVFALDVTDPKKPGFLWEYTHPGLYRSRGAPATAKIGRMNDRGASVWATFLSSGQIGFSERPSLFVVDAARGTLMKRVRLDVGETNTGAILSGSAAVVDSDGNGFADRAYLSDNAGNVYRVDFPDRADAPWDPDRITVSLLVKVSGPIYATPLVYLAHDYKPDGTIDTAHVKVMFGTGDDPVLADNPNAPAGYRFYVFDDTCLMDWAAGELRDPKGLICRRQGMQTEADAQWSWTLPVGHRIWAEAVAAAGRVYFGTAVSDTDDPCSPVQDEEKKGGKVYAIELSALETMSEPIVLAETGGNVTALVVEDEHLYAKVSSRDDGARVQVVGDGVFNNETILGDRYRTKKIKGSWRRILEK